MRSKVMWAAIILLGATTLVACQPSQPLDAAAKEPEPQLQLDTPEPAPSAAEIKPVQPRKPPANAKAAAAPKAMTAVTAPVPADPAPAAADAPVLESRAVAARQDEEQPVATTLTGCLVHDDDMFQLKDTDGAHAPKARSWKSGFIKRSSAKVAVLDPNNRLKLASHVGHRISVSGTLTEREIDARWINATSERCD
jgi:hypothetical protein